MKRGDHVFVNRSAKYSHHGIYLGKKRVIHFTGEPGSKSNASIRETTFEEFCDGDTPFILEYSECFSANKTIRLAREKMGEKDYGLFTNNCEHFARYCKTGEIKSDQVTDVFTVTGAAVGTYALGTGSLTLVASAGTAAGLSGAGVMSGLAGIGIGGAMGGLATLAAVPAIVTNIAVHKSLADDKNLSKRERNLRSSGRTAAKVGTVVGAAGTVATISAVGTTAGLSAAGIASGLAALGGTVSGGMATGAAIAVAAPAVAAGIAGWGIYKIGKWWSD